MNLNLKMDELNEKMAKYVSNNIDMAKALTQKKQKITELENLLLNNEVQVFEARKYKQENKILRTELENTIRQCEVFQKHVQETEKQLQNWRLFITDLVKFNTMKFAEAIKMMTEPNGVAQQTASNVKLESVSQQGNKSNEANQARAVSMGNPCNPDGSLSPDSIQCLEDTLKNQTEYLNELSERSSMNAKESSKRKSLSLTESPLHLEEMSPAKTFYPNVLIDYNEAQSEFSDDSIAESSSKAKLELNSRRSIEAKRMNPFELSDILEMSKDTKSNSIDTSSVSDSIEMGASLNVQPTTPRINVSRPSKSFHGSPKRKSDEHSLRVTMHRKRFSTDELAPAFTTKSPRLSDSKDLNESSIVDSSVTFSCSSLSPVIEQSKGASYFTDSSTLGQLSQSNILSPSRRSVSSAARSKVFSRTKGSKFPQSTPKKNVLTLKTNCKNIQNSLWQSKAKSDELFQNSMCCPSTNHQNEKRWSKAPTFFVVDQDVQDEINTQRKPLSTFHTVDNANRPMKEAEHKEDKYQNDEELITEAQADTRRRPLRRTTQVDYREPLLKYRGRF